MQEHLKKHTATVLILFLSAGMLGLTSPPTREQARRTAYRASLLLEVAGYSIRENYRYGFLERGESVVFATTLYRGNDYAIIVGGCNDAYDIDVYIYDENSNLIDRDTDSSDVGVIEVSPRWTGTYYIKVLMYNSVRSGAHWALVYGYK